MAFADYSTLNTLYLRDNSSLTGCGVSWLCQYLARGGYALISGNAPSCNYPAIPQNCATAPTNDLVVSGTQAISGSYRNVTVMGTGVATLSGPLAVAGTLAVQSGGQLATACQPLTGAGNFFLLSGGRLAVCDPAGLAATGASGAVQLTGTRLFHAGGEYAYTGTQPQATGNGLPTTVRRLALDNPAGLSLSRPVAVAQVLTLSAGTLSTSGQALTLRSDTTGTAMVVHAGGQVSGPVTVQRAIDPALNPGLGYRHYAPPVVSTTVADLATPGFAPVVNGAYNASATPLSVTPFPTVFGYDQSRLASASNNLGAFNKGWFSPAATTDMLVLGVGYTVNIGASETVDFVGSLFSGTLTMSLARTVGPTAAESGWQLRGNPYASPLDWSLVAPADRAGLDGSMYVYQSTGQYGGQYRAFVNGIGGNPLVGVAQGFFVRVSQGQTSGTLTLRNTHRLTSYANVALQRNAADTRPRVQLQLQAANGESDVAYVYFEGGASAGVDPEFDAVKLPNTTGLNLAAVAAGQELAIQGLPALGTAEVTVPLAVQVPATGSYTLHAAELLHLGSAHAYLRDRQTGALVDLQAQPGYSFTQNAAFTGPRFELVFAPQRLLGTASASLSAQVVVYPNPASKSVQVELPASLARTAVTAELVDALGRLVRTQALATEAAAQAVSLHGVAAGVYALRLRTAQGTVSKKLVVE